MPRMFVWFLGLLAVAGPCFASAPSQWTEIRSPHFVVLTDSNEKQGRKIAGQFERMRSLFQTLLPNAGGDAGLPITVLAFKNRGGFQSVIPAAYLAKGQLQLAGYFLNTPDRNYIVLRLDAEGEHPFSVVYHEYTHFIVRKAHWLPLWLNEGLAEYYQNTDIEEKDVRLGQPSVDDILYLRQERLLPLPTLFAVDHNSPYYHEEQKGSVFYAESWALTHFIEMTDFKNKTHRVQDYAHLLAKGDDPVKAAQLAFGDLGQLQKQLDDYVSHGQYQLLFMKSSFTADAASFTARPVSTDVVNAARADVLVGSDRQAEARTLLEQVLRNDPKNALAHETMGSLAYRGHDLAAAKKWYGEAVQLDSKSYLAYFHYATLSMMDDDRDHDDAIEAGLRHCMELEPGFAPAYDALANFFVMRHKDLDEAHLLTLRAVQLEPDDLHYRLNAAQVLVEQKNFDAALSVLHEAEAHVAKTTGEVGMVEMRISQIKQYQDFTAERREASQHAQSGGPEVSIGETTSVIGHASRPPSAEEERVWPKASPSAPHHTARGVVHNVRCVYPTVLTLSLDAPGGKGLALFMPNYFKVPFTTANYQPSGDMDPCKALDGMKARIEYADVTDKDLAGQVISVELSR